MRELRLPGLRGIIAADPWELAQPSPSLGTLSCMLIALAEPCAEGEVTLRMELIPLSQPKSCCLAAPFFPTLGEDIPGAACSQEAQVRALALWPQVSSSVFHSELSFCCSWILSCPQAAINPWVPGCIVHSANWDCDAGTCSPFVLSQSLT